MNELDKQKIEEYNSYPVSYCRHCLSLKIMTLEDTKGYCDNCGSTDIEETVIELWENLYKEKYNKKFLENGREYTKSRGYGA